jgi:hypothetical protein
MVGLVLQCKKCDCRRINVRLKWGPENETIPGIPSAIGACTIEQHLHSELDAVGSTFRRTTTGKPLERNECECGGNDPTHSSRKPGPPVFVWIELDLPIGNAKLQVPDPVGFTARISNQPLNPALSAIIVLPTHKGDYRQ